VGLAVIAALAVAVPAFGVSKSLKKAIKKEVSKQIGSAKGPAGTNGTNGKNGEPGTARAYARVLSGCTAGTNPCPVDHAKGITVRAGSLSGTYCVLPAGIDPSTTAPVTTVDENGTIEAGNTRVNILTGTVTVCNSDEFKVFTSRQSVSGGVLISSFDTNVSWTVVVP
jgi:hypothetical protein